MNMNNISRDIVLTDGKVKILPHGPEYMDHVYAAVMESRAEIMPWMGWMHPGYDMHDTRLWLESRHEAWANGTDYAFAILDAQDDSFLGNCGLNHIDRDSRFANLGYLIRTSQTRRGAATAAARLVAGFGFDTLKMVRLEIVVSTGNKASQRVAEKAGALREGVWIRIAKRTNQYSESESETGVESVVRIGISVVCDTNTMRRS